MNPLDNDVRLALYGFFVDRQRPPTPTELVTIVDVDQASIEASLRRLHDAHVIVLEPGTPYVWMANPLSAVPTPFRVRISDGRQYYGSCIWDALGILAMLASDGHVETSCRDCGTDLTVEVEADELVGTDGVVHYAVPAARWWDDIGFA